MVGLLNGFCQLHRMNVNGFQRTFLFLNELPRSSRCNINAKSASSWSSLITVSSLTEVLSLCHCCQAKYKSTNLHLQWQTLTLLPYPHLQLRLLLLFFLYFPSHLISLAVSIPSLDSMPSNHSQRLLLLLFLPLVIYFSHSWGYNYHHGVLLQASKE